MKSKKLLVLGIVLLIIAVIAGVFFFFNPFASIPKEENIAILPFQDPGCSQSFTPRFNTPPYYQGPLFDSHFHIPPTFEHEQSGSKFPVLGKEITLTQIICQFEKEKVIGAFAFYFPNYWLLMDETKSEKDIFAKWLTEANQIKNGVPPWVHLFFTPGPLKAESISVINDSAQGIFAGFGEIVYFFPAAPRFFSRPDDEISLGIEKIADENRLMVMLHPSQGQKDSLEKALQKNPHATFILHGWQHDDYIWKLMDKYPNLYFSLDAATLYPIYGLIDGPEDKFLAKFNQQFNSLLNTDLAKWKVQIERYPDRYMWGTDKSADFHYTEKMSLLFEEFARAFIGRLSPAVQEKFAYKNAEALLH